MRRTYTDVSEYTEARDRARAYDRRKAREAQPLAPGDAVEVMMGTADNYEWVPCRVLSLATDGVFRGLVRVAWDGGSMYVEARRVRRAQ